MKRTYSLGILTGCVLVAMLGAGCSTDARATRIVEHKPGTGKLAQDILGTGDQLVKSGRIDLHRRVESFDKTEIDTWVLRANRNTEKQGRGTAVILHRLYEHKADFPYFGAAERLARKGFDAVLIDLRSHGRSGGKYVTYGGNEKLDIKAVVDELLRDGEIHEPIYVFGVELGAATAIQYAAIDPRCKGVIAMTAFTDARTVARSRLPLLSPEDFEEALEAAGKLANFDPDEASSVKAAAKLDKTPLLLVYGILDLTVPSEHGKIIYEAAAGPKKLVLKPILDFAIIEDWIADRVEELATKGLAEDDD